MKKIITSIVFVLFGLFVSRGAEPDTLKCSVFFREIITEIDLSYKDNAKQIESFCKKLESIQKGNKIKSITILSSASPKGRGSLNDTLAAKRGRALAEMLMERLDLRDSQFNYEKIEENWEELSDIIQKSSGKYKPQILKIISEPSYIKQRYGMKRDQRKFKLMDMNKGKVWKELSDNEFLQLCYAKVIKVEFEPLPTVIVEEKPAPVEIKEDNSARQTPAPQLQEDKRKPFYWSLRTNFIHDLGLVPNIGAEVYLGKGWSAGINWNYSWWDKGRYYWKTYGGDLYFRKYFGKAASQKPLTGHHIGIYGQWYTFDFELGGKGIMSFAPYNGGKLNNLPGYGMFGGGIEYGYALPIAKRLNLDFSCGIGYLGGVVINYVPSGSHFKYVSHEYKHIPMPKAEISLVWLLGYGNRNKK